MLTKPCDAAASADATRRHVHHHPPCPAFTALAALQVFKGGRSDIRTHVIIHILTVLTHPVSHLYHPERRVGAQTTGLPHQQKNLAKWEELQKKATTARPHIVLSTIASHSSSTDADAKWALYNLMCVHVHPKELGPNVWELPTHATHPQDAKATHYLAPY